MNVKIVVGSNFGDEGKGLMVNYFCKNNIKNHPIVIKHNGGCQAGHTVIKDNIRHVFHSFGAGTLHNIPTYLAEDFVLNPSLFKNEYEELLEKDSSLLIKCFISPNCVISTYLDVLINQLIECKRGNAKHGSCGVGIYETFLRNNEEKLTYKALVNNILNGIDIFKKLREYTYERLNQLEIEITDEIKDIIENDKYKTKYIEDLSFMWNHSKEKNIDFLLGYETLIFESAQGLLLDQNNMEYFPFLTPSNTGSTNPAKYLKQLNIQENIEICYVTRTYLTRHGAGFIKTECEKSDINKDMIDLTNVPNLYQGTMKYGYIDLDELYLRINNDSKNIPHAKISLAITHINETKSVKTTKGDVDINKINNLKYFFDNEII